MGSLNVLVLLVRGYYLFVIRGTGSPWTYCSRPKNNKEVDFVKNTDKKITINIFSGNKISIDGKSLVMIIVAIVCLTLVVSFCSPELRANIIRLLISIAESY